MNVPNGDNTASANLAEPEQAAADSRRISEQLRIITDSMAASVTRCSRDLRYEWVSKPYADWLGRAEREIVGQPIVDVIGLEAFERLLPRFWDVLSGKVVRYEEHVDFAKIGRRWVNAVYTPTLGPDGLVDGWVAVVNDLTDRKEIEHALRVSEDRLREGEKRWRTLTEALPNLVWTDLPDGQCDWLSTQWGKYTGIPETELLGLRWLDRVIHPDDRARTLACWQKACADEGDYDLEYRIRRYDGEYRWFKTRGVPIRDEERKIVYWFGTCTDIDDHKRAEEALAKRERDFRTLADNTPALVARFDRQLRHLFVNRQVELMTGLPASAYLGKSNREMGVPEELYSAGDQRLRSVFATGQVAALDFAYSSPAGLRQFHSWFGPEFGPNGQVESALCITRDVTEQKHLEDELRRRVEDLAEADRRKDEFLATLAHELRNPLAPLRAGLDVMRIAKNDATTIEQMWTMMDRQLQQMVRLIDDLLHVSRISRGKIELQRTQVPLGMVVRNAVETSRPLVEQFGHELSLSLPNESIFVDADITRLSQVFANLLNNAAKYTDRGGRIRLAVERQGSDAVVTVEDNGTGIPAHLLSEVFEMFTQLDRRLEKSHGGLGIGLSIAKRLVEMHGGTIEAASDGLAKGSTFTVRLPVVMSVGEKNNGDDAEADIEPGVRLRILVVDDNRDTAAGLAIMLQVKGNETRTANDGIEAVNVAAEFKPDVILLDIGMPRLNGYDACRRIREQAWGKDALIVACTGWGQDEDKRKSKEAGFDFHMVKPVTASALLKLLAGAIQERFHSPAESNDQA